MNEQKRIIFVDTLTKEYNHDKYVLFLKELLDNMKLVAPAKEIKPYNIFSAAIDHYRHIGNYTGEDNNKVALFSVCLANDKNLENARSMQRAFVKSLLKNSDCAAALVSFYTKDDLDKWRLSLVRLDYDFSNGKLSENLTPAKRYSYLVGKGEPCHTAQERLYPIFVEDDLDPSLDELEEAFSVEAVTKDFFDKYREKYLEIKEYLDTNSDFINEAETRGFDSEQFAKKLMGQIVFLYFIQKKGWLGVNAFPTKLTEREYKNSYYRSGSKPKILMPLVYKQQPDGMYKLNVQALLDLTPEDETALSTIVKGDAWGEGPKDFMRQIFNGCKIKGLNFFDDYLEPLFYTGLNQNRGENAFFPPLHRRIPFLNGGLFEEMEGYDWRNNDFRIPNELFSNVDEKGREADGILDVFERYNFTMAEDEPMEREVAIDPEMLGKVFENLLDISDRKSKGAFYTPREIVHYMCQECIINYLCGKTGIPEGDIRKFVLYGEYFRDEDTKKTNFIPGQNGAKGHMEFDKTKDLEIPATIFSYKGNVNRLQEIDTLLANVKVVDLAVGSGAFPVGMLTEIVKARETVTSYMLIDMNSYQRLSYRSMRNPYRMKRETIKNSIFACDIEASATDITKLRLWLSLVIDNQIMDQEDEMLGYSTKPRELPNLDCNIICGNSLVDEFEGISLLTENAVLQNESENRQLTTYDVTLGVLINELIELQTKLYDEKDRAIKDDLKNQIQDIYNQIVLEQIQSNNKVIDDYYQAILQPSKPFVLWQLYFPKVFRDNGGFDIAIGNPPYVLLQDTLRNDDELKYYRLKYSVAKYKVDLYHLFIERAVELVNKEGIVSLIVPSNFTTNNYCKDLRKFMLERLMLRDIVYYDNNVFAANVNNLVFVGRRIKNNSIASDYMIHMVLSSKKDNGWTIKDEKLLKQRSFMKEDFIISPSGEQGTVEIMNKIESNNSSLNTIAKVNFGMQLRNRKKFLNDVITDVSRLTPDHKPCYTGKDIGFYRVKYNKLYCYFNEEARCGGCWDITAQFAKPKILVRQIGKYPVAGLDEKGYAVLNTAFMITGFKDVSPYYILALMNSKVIRFYWLIKFSDNRKQFPKIKGTYLERIPIARNLENEKKIIEIVKRILCNRDINADNAELGTIDEIIFDTYCLTKEEKIMINNYCEKNV